MTVNDIIVFIIAGFVVLGCLDKAILNGKLGLAGAVESGVAQIGGLIFFLVGVMCLVPLITKLLTPLLTPLYGLFGGDPAAFAGIIIGPDAGGYAMAASMTQNEQVIALSGIFLSSMLGLTVIFALPWGMGVVKKEDQEFLLKGMICGIIASPIGAIIAGLVAGFNMGFMLINLIPAIVIVIILVILLFVAQKVVISILKWYSRIIQGLAAAAVGFASFEMLTGIKLIPWIDSMGDKLSIMGNIGISMGGALAFVFVLQKILRKPFMAFGRKVKINDTAVLGLVAAMANAMPVLSDMYKDMDRRGKLIVAAFTAPAWCAFGSHLAFTSTVMPQYLLPMIVGKLAGGIIAIVLAMLFFGKQVGVDEAMISGKANTPVQSAE